MYYLSQDNPKYQGLAHLLDSAKIEFSFEKCDGIKVVDEISSDNEISFATVVRNLSKEIVCIGACGEEKNIITAMLMQVFSGFKETSYLMEKEGFLKEDSDYFALAMYDEDLLAYRPEYAIISKPKNLGKYVSFARNVKEAILCDEDYVEDVLVSDIDLPFFSYGFSEGADFSACNLEIDEEYARFDLNFKSNYVGSYVLPILDKRTLKDALSVIALATLYCFDSRKIELLLTQYR